MEQIPKIPDRKIMRLKCYDYNAPGMYFMTICTKEKACILSQIIGDGIAAPPQVVLSRFGLIAEKYIRQLNDFYDHIRVERYVIMPNHIHILFSVLHVPSSFSSTTVQNSIVSRFIATFKRFCNKEYGDNIWQRSSYDHVIRDEHDYVMHCEYIDANPVRWHEDSLNPMYRGMPQSSNGVY